MNNYNNAYGYNPYQYQQQYKQYAFVNGIEGAKAFQMPTNQTMLLMDSDKPIVFMKTTDNVGKANIRYFNLTEISEADTLKQYQPQPVPEYALKSDIEALNEKIDKLLGLTSKTDLKGE